MARRLVRLAVIALAVAGADQVLKAVMVAWLADGPVQVIPSFARFILVYNTGAAFGAFANMEFSRWLLVGATVVALGLATWVAAGKLGTHRASLWCLGLICGGALGNLVDRLRLGEVVDFVLLYYKGLGWPAFNLADAAISIGGVWLAILLLRGKA